MSAVLQHLATALGYTPTLDTPAGYGVQRVILDRPCAGSTVFDPAENDGQAMEVLCWLLVNAPQDRDEFACLTRWQFEVHAADTYEDGVSHQVAAMPHGNTPASLRAAIVQAAGRVCGS